MKKGLTVLFSIILVLAMMAGLTACGGAAQTPAGTTAPSTETAAARPDAMHAATPDRPRTICATPRSRRGP